jgi:hydroxymethylglutaryl-CoA lyase
MDTTTDTTTDTTADRTADRTTDPTKTGGIRIVECPRDAWQGLPRQIPSKLKAAYLRLLVDAGFRHIDAVSFVSPKHVRQMADSEAVLDAFFASLPADAASPEIIGIVVNEKGAERALAARGVTTLGYPYSISAYFRRANANMSRSESRALVEQLHTASTAARRDLVVYVSMAFGNPYDEPWGPELVEETLLWLKEMGVRAVSLADTVGTATPAEVGSLYDSVKEAATGIELGVHLHSRPEGAAEKVMAAYNAGCRRFDSALTGLGGCPFAGDDLVGNVATETVVRVLSENGIATGFDLSALAPAMVEMHEIREKYSAPD